MANKPAAGQSITAPQPPHNRTSISSTIQQDWQALLDKLQRELSEPYRIEPDTKA
jgi:hypothetical protein